MGHYAIKLMHTVISSLYQLWIIIVSLPGAPGGRNQEIGSSGSCDSLCVIKAHKGFRFPLLHPPSKIVPLNYHFSTVSQSLIFAGKNVSVSPISGVGVIGH